MGIMLSLFFVFSVVLSQFVFSENPEDIKSTESFSLEQAVNLAVQNNYEIKKQRYALAAAQASSHTARAQATSSSDAPSLGRMVVACAHR